MIEIYLPFPPSVNTLYPNNEGGRGRHKSKRYKAWQESAWYSARAVRPVKAVGKIEVVISLVRPDKRKRDCANYEKAVTDFLVYAGIIEDDSLIERNTQEWWISPNPSHECRVVIRGWEE